MFYKTRTFNLHVHFSDSRYLLLHVSKQTYHPKLPYIAVKRICVPITVAPHGKVRRSIVRGALDRIQHLPRSHVGASAEDDFLNAKASVYFDDTVHSIRAQTAALLKRVHSPIPHAVRPLPISGSYKYIETPIPERISSDAYINVMLMSPNERVLRNVVPMSHYPETTHQRNLSGGGRLACVSFAAGRVYPRRRLMIFDENNYRNVRNDVQYLSYYTKTRNEAEKQHPKIKLEEEAKPREELIIKPVHSTHTHVSFQTPLKPEEPIVNPIKTTEPVRADDIETVCQKEVEIDAWLTHQKKKKSKAEAKNNEDHLNEIIATQNEELPTPKEIDQPSTESKPAFIEKEDPTEESTIEPTEQEEVAEVLAQELQEQPLEADAEEVLETKEPQQEQDTTENETDLREEVLQADEEKVDTPLDETEKVTAEEKISEDLTKADAMDDDQEENITEENKFETIEKQPEPQTTDEDFEREEQVDNVEEEKKLEEEEPVVEEEVVDHIEPEESEEPQGEKPIEEDQRQEEEGQGKEETVAKEEPEVQTEDEGPSEPETHEDTDVEAEVEPEVEPEVEAGKESAAEEEVTENLPENDAVTNQSVAEVREASEVEDCSTLEHKDNDGPKSDSEISEIEEDECAVPEKASVKDTLHPVDVNLDDSSLVDDVFEADAPEAQRESKTQPDITTDEEYEEDSN